MFKRTCATDLSTSVKKRHKSGHEKTPMAFCLSCFKSQKERFWLSRFIASSIKAHLESVHKDGTVCKSQVFPADSQSTCKRSTKILSKDR